MLQFQAPILVFCLFIVITLLIRLMDTTFNYVAQPEIEILKSISDSAGLSIQEGYVPERGQV